jgi:Cys-tRNA(Pro) deacylase
MKDLTDMPVTTAIRALRDKAIPFTPHVYPYVDRGGTRHAAECLGVSEHAMVKTLVMETDTLTPLIVLMHGDREVSTKALARVIGAKSVSPCAPDTAQRHTGYLVGGTSPFGTRKPLPIYVEESLLTLDRIYINGGRRGLLVELIPADLRKALPITPVCVSQAAS